MKKSIGRLINIFKKDTSKIWKDIEYFDPEWKERIKEMAQYIEPNNSIVDLGCGKMWLKDFITINNVYYPVDYIKRDNKTLIYDFNKYEYPNINADIAFVSGCLEYVKDYKWFISMICKKHEKCIISYCIMEDFPDLKQRKSFAWVNHLKEKELINLFADNQYNFERKKIGYSTFFIFTKKPLKV